MAVPRAAAAYGRQLKTRNTSWLDALTHLNLEAAERILTMSGHFTVDNEF